MRCARGSESHLYSADLVGAARALLDVDGSTSIFLPGPLGDQNPAGENSEPRPPDVATQQVNVRNFGRRMVAALGEIWTSPREDASLAFSEVQIDRLPIRLHAGSFMWWISPIARPQIDRFVSKRGLFQALRVGNACFASFPAEPSSELGDGARRLVPNDCTPFVIAHANDWMGYAVTADDYEYGGYEVQLSVFGPGFGDWLLDGVGRALAGLPRTSFAESQTDAVPANAREITPRRARRAAAGSAR